MRSCSRLWLAAVVVAVATPVSAQIISTSIPKAPSGGGGSSVSFHLMGGYTYWKIDTFESLKTDIPTLGLGLTASGGNNGFLGAADLAFKATDAVSLGVGGWFNRISDFQFVPAGLYASNSNNVLAAYGSIFYKRVGIQAGIVRATFTESGSLPLRGPVDSFTDVDAFAVYRMGGKYSGETRWAFSLGAGIYRNAAQPAGGTFFGKPYPETPSSTVFTGYVNGSLGLYKGLSVDGSYWRVEKSEKTGASGSDRFSVGLGYTF